MQVGHLGESKNFQYVLLASASIMSGYDRLTFHIVVLHTFKVYINFTF